jgi:hypothetical protein
MHFVRRAPLFSKPLVSTGLAFAVSSLLLAACSGHAAGSLTPALDDSQTPRIQASDAKTKASRFPGASASGVAAHYIVYVQQNSKAASTIAVVPAQEKAGYLKAFAAKPLPRVAIVYPDRSRQQTDANGAFDAGLSTYAAAHPEKLTGTDVAIVVEPPAVSGIKSLKTSIFAPSEKEELAMTSGVIPTHAKPEASPSPGVVREPHYIWSCHPADYLYRTIVYVRRGEFGALHFTAKPLDMAWYAPHFYGCGTDIDQGRLVPFSEMRWVGDNQGNRWTIDYQLTPSPERLAVWASPSYYVADKIMNVHVAITRI